MSYVAKGSIVVDERIVPITDIYLDGGLIHFVASVRGPFPAVTATGYTVHDRQGREVYRVPEGIGGLTWRELHTCCDYLTVIAPLQIAGAHALHPVRPR